MALIVIVECVYHFLLDGVTFSLLGREQIRTFYAPHLAAGPAGCGGHFLPQHVWARRALVPVDEDHEKQRCCPGARGPSPPPRPRPALSGQCSISGACSVRKLLLSSCAFHPSLLCSWLRNKPRMTCPTDQSCCICTLHFKLTSKVNSV